MLEVTSLNILEVTHEVEEFVKNRLPLRFLKSSEITNHEAYLESIGAAKLLLDYFPLLKDEDIVFNSNGKPSFKNSNLHFNISHSKGQIVLAVSDKSVGIDIEKIDKNRIKNIDKIFPNLTFVNKENGLRIWTIKEAYCKCLGDNIFNCDLNSDLYPLYNKNVLLKNGHEYILDSSFKIDGFECSIIIENR